MKERLFTLVMTVVAAALVLSGCQTAPAETPLRPRVSKEVS